MSAGDRPSNYRACYLGRRLSVDAANCEQQCRASPWALDRITLYVDTCIQQTMCLWNLRSKGVTAIVLVNGLLRVQFFKIS